MKRIPRARLGLFLASATLLSCLPGHLSGQSLLRNGYLEYNGKITSFGDVDEWVFHANQGDFISLRMAVDEFRDDDPQPYIVFDFNGEVLWSDSNRFDMNTTLTAPYTGTYHIVIGDLTDVPWFGRLEYRLSLARSGAPFELNVGDEGGPMTNGGRHEGELIRGDSDLWSFEVEAGQYVDLSVATTAQTGNLGPGLRVFREDGSLAAFDFDGENSKVSFQADSSGTYSALVQNDGSDDDAEGHYALYLVAFPDDAFTVPEGDEGGSLVNGAVTQGFIDKGDTDLWEFEGEVGDYVDINFAEVAETSQFSPYLWVIGPDGDIVVFDSDTDVAEVSFVVEQAGSHTVVVENGEPNHPETTADYHLFFSRIPGTNTISTGDEGGGLENGATTPGTISRGDVDLWTFTAGVGDYVFLSFAEALETFQFTPEMQVFDPLGEKVVFGHDAEATFLHFTSNMAGTYTVLVENGEPNHPDTPADYRLVLAQVPGVFVVSDGDEGGSLVNGGEVGGFIGRGDVDLWTFAAEKGESVVVRCAETTPTANFSMRIRLIGPDGAVLGEDTDSEVSEVSFAAPLSGAYTVLVVNGHANRPETTADYRLRLHRMPAPFIVPAGDEGGALSNGFGVTGFLGRGDADRWTFEATPGETAAIQFAETSPTSGFSPRVRVYGPDGALLRTGSDSEVWSLGFSPSRAGVHSILVSNGNANAPEVEGSYALHLAQTPRPFGVAGGDEGGGLDFGDTVEGELTLGDVDMWSFVARRNDHIRVDGEVLAGSGNLFLWVRIVDPEGNVIASWDDDESVTLVRTAPMTGRYTVLVRDAYLNGPESIGFYSLSLNSDTYSPGFVSFMGAHGATGGLAAFDSDWNGDGFSNGLKYALGEAPDEWTGGAQGNPRVRVTDDRAGIGFAVPSSPPAEVTYYIEASSTLQSDDWEVVARLDPGADTWTLLSGDVVVENAGGHGSEVVVRFTTPMAPGEFVSFRLRVEHSTP